MDSLIGDFFLKNGQGKAQHIEAVTGEDKLKALFLYFGGAWAPPCVEFLPELKDFYDIVNKDEKQIECVFVSCDKSIKDFQAHFAQMPWFALGFNDSHISKIEAHCDVDCVPRVAVLNPKNGAVLIPNLRPDIEEKKAEAMALVEEALGGGPPRGDDA